VGGLGVLEDGQGITGSRVLDVVTGGCGWVSCLYCLNVCCSLLGAPIVYLQFTVLLTYNMHAYGWA
jgi:hypothetical protein